MGDYILNNPVYVFPSASIRDKVLSDAPEGALAYLTDTARFHVWHDGWEPLPEAG